MLRGLESNLNLPRNPQGDVIILLGGGVYDKAPDLTGVGVPYQRVQAGIVTAVRLQKRLNVPIIVSGGKVFEFKSAEAPIIKRFLVDLGVSNDQIILEEKSRDTLENAKYTREICRRFSYINPILITSAFHIKRAILSFKKAGLEVIPFPAIFPSWLNKQYHWNDYLPGNFKKASTAIGEYLGIVFYRLLG